MIIPDVSPKVYLDLKSDPTNYEAVIATTGQEITCCIQRSSSLGTYWCMIINNAGVNQNLE